MSSSSIATNNNNSLHRLTDHNVDILSHPAFLSMMKQIADMSSQIKELHTALLGTKTDLRKKQLSKKEQLQQDVMNKMAKKKARLLNA